MSAHLSPRRPINSNLRERRSTQSSAWVFALAVFAFVGFASAPTRAQATGVFEDTRDGTLYGWVDIDGQIWMSENLRYDSGAGSSCYDGDAANCVDFGRLYTWVDANNDHGNGTDVCPDGFHVPTAGEWNILDTFVGGNSGGLKSTSPLWNPPNSGATNATGFKALPGGARFDTGLYVNVNAQATFATSTPGAVGQGLYRHVSAANTNFLQASLPDGSSYSVRCLSDTGIPPDPPSGVSDGTMGTFIDDRDGREYGWVAIDGEIWMQDNLAFDTGAGSFCYDDIASNCVEYGQLYTWNDATTNHGNGMDVCPVGFHLPDTSEWNALEAHVGPGSGAVKSTSVLWEPPNLGATNSSGFTAQPAGGRFNDGTFINLGHQANFWTANDAGPTLAVYRSMASANTNFPALSLPRDTAFSVRCVSDTGTPPEPPTMLETGTTSDTRDGEKYPWVKIGDQYWLSKNLNYGVGFDDDSCYAEIAASCTVFGRLYTQAEATGGSDVCGGGIAGMRVPTVADWNELEAFLNPSAGGKIKSTSNLWDPPNTGATNSSGFSALPGGLQLGGVHTNGGVQGNFWTSTSAAPGVFAARAVASSLTVFQKPNLAGDSRLSVRCVSDVEPPLATGDIVLGNYAFNATDVVDRVVAEIGPDPISVFPKSATAEEVLTNVNLADAVVVSAGSWVSKGIALGFSDNSVVNGPGPDLVVFSVDDNPIVVQIPTQDGLERTIQATAAGFGIGQPSTPVTAYEIDLAHLGFSAGDAIAEFVVLNPHNGSFTLLGAAALNSGPPHHVKGGYFIPFADFADSLIDSLNLVERRANVADALTDAFLYTVVTMPTGGATAELAFTDNTVVNGPGNDLVVFTESPAAPFMEVDGNLFGPSPAAAIGTHDLVPSFAHEYDLSNAGLPPGFMTDRVTLRNFGILMFVQDVAALNSGPSGVTKGEFQFDSSFVFADELVGDQFLVGPFNAPSAAHGVEDTNLATGAIVGPEVPAGPFQTLPGHIRMRFTDNSVLNRGGPDLVVFSTDSKPVHVEIQGRRHGVTGRPVGVIDGQNLFAHEFEFDNLNIAPGARVDEVQVQNRDPNANKTITGIAALNSGPPVGPTHVFGPDPYFINPFRNVDLLTGEDPEVEPFGPPGIDIETAITDLDVLNTGVVLPGGLNPKGIDLAFLDNAVRNEAGNDIVIILEDLSPSDVALKVTAPVGGPFSAFYNCDNEFGSNCEAGEIFLNGQPRTVVLVDLTDLGHQGNALIDTITVETAPHGQEIMGGVAGSEFESATVLGVFTAHPVLPGLAIGPYFFDRSDVFVDVLISNPLGLATFPDGSTVPDPPTKTEAITDSDLTTGVSPVSGPNAPATIQLGWMDNVVVNEPGADVVIFATNSADFLVQIPFGGLTKRVSGTVIGGFEGRGPEQPAIEAIEIDLSDFEIPDGALIDTIGITDLEKPATATADIAAVAALNSISLIARPDDTNSAGPNADPSITATDPVVLTTGAYTISRKLIEPQSSLIPIPFEIHYTSIDGTLAPLGLNWRHSFMWSVEESASGDLTVRRGTGGAEYFNSFSGLYAPRFPGTYGAVAKNGDGTFDYLSVDNVLYHFRTDGQLSQIIDTNGNSLVLSYDGQDRLATVQYPNGVPLGFAYDGQDRLIDVDVGGTSEVSFSYDAEGFLADYTQPGGRSMSFTYDAIGNILTALREDGTAIVTNTYDGAGRVVSQLDALGSQSTIDYSNRSQAIVTDRLGFATTSTFNSQDRLSNLEDPVGNLWSMTYDEDGNQTQLITPLGFSTKSTFNDLGDVLTYRNESGNTISFEYDASGNNTAMIDPLGNRFEFEYDANDNLVRAISPTGDSDTWLYDQGLLVEERNALGQPKTYGYDVLNRLESVTDALGGTLLLDYDGLNRVTKMTKPEGGEFSFTYDAAGRPVTYTDPLGNATSVSYDVVGNTASITDPLGNTRTFGYDPDSALRTATNPLGETYSYDYDAERRVVGMSNPLGETTLFEWDPIGNLTQTTDPAGGLVAATYDAEGNRTSVTDPNGNTTTYEHDPQGRVTRETSAAGNRRDVEFNANGQVVEVRNGRRHRIRLDYDDTGRLERVRARNHDVEYEYDAQGNPTRIEQDGKFDTARTYDALDRVESRTDENGNTVGYEYDANGNVTALIYPDGQRAEYTYDAVDRLTSVTDWDGNVTSYTYDAAGRIAETTLPGGGGVEYTYDAAGRVTEIVDEAAGGTPVFSGQYQYDAAGRRVGETTVLPLEATRQASTDVFTYGANNELERVNGTRVRHDKDGNLRRAPIDGENRSFRYDSFGQLVRYGNEKYEYDAEGLRKTAKLGRTAGRTKSETVHYVWDRNPNGVLPRLLEERDENGNVIARYVHGQGLISRISAGGDVSVYHYDSRGSAVALSDEAGQITDRYAYDPFGRLAARDGLTRNPFTYLGTYSVLDDGNGIYHTGSRIYVPSLRRFAQPDPIRRGTMASSQSLNPYTYAGNNPITQIDPNGQAFWVAIFSVGKALIDAGIQLVSNLIEGRPLFEDVAKAAINGAITGAAIGICGKNPACDAVAAGLGEAAGEFIEQSIEIATGRRDSIDFGEIASGAGMAFVESIATGGFGGKGGKGAFKAAKARAAAIVAKGGSRTARDLGGKITLKAALDQAKENSVTFTKRAAINNLKGDLKDGAKDLTILGATEGITLTAESILK